MTNLEPAYRSILAAELKERQRRNSSYSLRAFARTLGISPTMLSQVLQGKRPITIQSAIKIVEALPLSEEERRRFLNSSYESRELNYSEDSWKTYFVDMAPDEFQLIADPIHFAILALGAVSGRRWNAEWISQKLGTSVEEAGEAMKRLLVLGLVEIDGEAFKQNSSPRRVKSPIPNAAIQSHHINTLQKAQSSLSHVPVEQREFNAITMAINSSKLEAARDLTARYLENMHSLLDGMDDKDSVYTIAVQIFPVSQNPGHA